MNYFEHHIGDYDASTTHLTWAEDLAYTRLIRLYCRRELPIPVDLADACRLIRAASREQKAAVESVLREFFEFQADGWHHARYDDAIARYRAGEPEREAKKANEDTRLRRHREERAELFSKLTAAGLHAPWNVAIGELRNLVHSLPSPLKATSFTPSPATKPATPATAPATPATATQEPIANSQEPIAKRRGGERTPTPDLTEVPPAILADYIAVRKAKKSSPLNCTAVAGLRREAALAGLTLTEAVTACVENDWRGFKADWYANLTRQQPGGSSQNSRHGPMSDTDRMAANAKANEEAKRLLFGKPGKLTDEQRNAINAAETQKAKDLYHERYGGGDVIDAETMLVEPSRQSDIFGVPPRTGQQALAQGRQRVAEPWASSKQNFGRPSSKHSGFEQQNYQDGINEDGSIAA